MFTIIGLGNPGKEYLNTRHNAGRVVLTEVLNNWGWGKPIHSAKLGGEICDGVIGTNSVRVLFPDTFMNHSGRAAKKALTQEPGTLVVVYDDVDLPFGEFKLSFGRGAGGHNGVSSVINEIGTPDFLRVRIGIAPKGWFGQVIRPRGDKLADYVLGQLTNRELSKLIGISDDVATALQLTVEKGKEEAMGKFN
ncbi:aminoacyl-tRNA hydrolase [Candidatus Nomurabacteria bacterium]|nr:aminoacyl-tRNA hydrolase [Candidatus Nomurabacteria bacterium]MCB9819436.1 aminoacyl-tRNA hydrolase [Candidatus Nomurabacteria bacterium]